VLYTAKHPSRCPNCGGTALSRKGSRTKKFETVQRWQCASCGRGFTPAPTELRAKTYPLRVILDGVTLYNLGYTLAEASAKLKAKSGYRVPSSTLAAWRYILVDDAAAGTTHYSHPQEGESADRPRNTRC